MVDFLLTVSLTFSRFVWVDVVVEGFDQDQKTRKSVRACAIEVPDGCALILLFQFFQHYISILVIRVQLEWCLIILDSMHLVRALGQQGSYFDCQKAAVVKWTPQESQFPSTHILHRVLLFTFVSVPHFGHFAKSCVMLMFLLISLFKGFWIEELTEGVWGFTLSCSRIGKKGDCAGDCGDVAIVVGVQTPSPAPICWGFWGAFGLCCISVFVFWRFWHRWSCRWIRSLLLLGRVPRVWFRRSLFSRLYTTCRLLCCGPSSLTRTWLNRESHV